MTLFTRYSCVFLNVDLTIRTSNMYVIKHDKTKTCISYNLHYAISGKICIICIAYIYIYIQFYVDMSFESNELGISLSSRLCPACSSQQGVVAHHLVGEFVTPNANRFTKSSPMAKWLVNDEHNSC